MLWFKEWFVYGNTKYSVRTTDKGVTAVWEYDPKTNWWYVVRDEQTINAVISLVDFTK